MSAFRFVLPAAGAHARSARAAASADRAGWLFAYDWDRDALQRLQQTIALDHAGFDLFRFPSNTRLIGFDLERFATRVAAAGRRHGWQAVLSHHEQFGALAAALVAEQLGLPGASPESICAAQHKLHARRVLQRVAPEANLAFAALEIEPGEPPPPGIDYPRFAKPVKAAFSVLAREVGCDADLVQLTQFSARERWVIEHLLAPFERVCRARLPQAGSAHCLLLEVPVPQSVPQFNLDGWVHDGAVHALGVVDAVMVPGTRAFMRWEVPSRLPAVVQARALDVARRFLQAIDYRSGFFNLEFFYDAAADRLSVIECNPRLASQFGDLYRRVLGADPHAMALALAQGNDPARVPRAQPTAGAAASLVYRAQTPAEVRRQPGAAQRAEFARAFPDGLLFGFAKHGHALQRDFKWTGSHRYGIVHLGGEDRDDLRARAELASALLGWPAPYLDARTTEAAATTAPTAPEPAAAWVAAPRDLLQAG